MISFDGRDGKNELIDLRQPLYIALRALVLAYLNGEIDLEELRDLQVHLSWNSYQIRDKFGDHPFFQLDCEFMGQCAVLRCHEGLEENHLKDALRRHLGLCSSNTFTTGSGSTDNPITVSFQ